VPLAVLSVRAQLVMPLTLSPPVIDLGTMKAGGTATTLVADIDERLLQRLPAGTVLRLPDAAAQLFTLSPAPAGATSSVAQAPGTRRQLFTLRLRPDAPFGLLQAPVMLVPSGVSASELSLWTSAASRVVGTLTGEITAFPQIVTFAPQPAERSQGVTTTVTLVGQSARTLGAVKVTSSSPQVEAILGAMPAVAPAAAGTVQTLQRPLEIRLAKGMQPGLLETLVTVTLASGKRLVIPVNAYIAPPAASGGSRP
jgi:hypothetical protein